MQTDGTFECPWDVAIDEQDNIYVLDNQGLHVLDANGKCLETTQREIPEKAGGVVARGGHLAITDMEKNTCEIYTTGSSGNLTHVSSQELGRYTLKVEDNFRGVAMDLDGNIYVADPNKYAIDKYSPEWELLGQIQTGYMRPGPMDWHPGHGLLTVDMVYRRVWLFTPAGQQ